MTQYLVAAKHGGAPDMLGVCARVVHEDDEAKASRISATFDPQTEGHVASSPL